MWSITKRKACTWIALTPLLLKNTNVLAKNTNLNGAYTVVIMFNIGA